MNQWKIMLLSLTLTMRGSHVASLVKSTQWFMLGGDSVMDGGKNDVALARPYYEGKLCSKFG